jgi:hypothetical protein
VAHIVKRKASGGENRWDVRWRVLGRPQTKTFKRRQDADAFRRTVDAEELRGVVVDVRQSSQRFADYATEWVATRRRHVDVWHGRILTEAHEQDTRDGAVTTGTKNESSRWTTLPPFVVDALTEHLDRYSQPGADGYVSSDRQAERCCGHTGTRASIGLGGRSACPSSIPTT